MKKVALLLLLSTSILLSSNAQVKIFTGQDTIDFGNNSYTAAIQVADFNQIIGAQFTLRWDSTVLSFDKISGPLEQLDFNDDNFGVMEIESGILRFLWYNPSLGGVNLTDSTALFSVDFNVIANTDAYTSLVFDDVPVAREVYDTSFNIIPAEFIDGFVQIGSGGTVSSSRNNPEELSILSVIPNPIRNNSVQVNFNLKKSDTLKFRIVSMNGQELQTHSQQFQAGKHNLNLNIDELLPAGTYVLRLESESFFAIQKIVIQK